MPGPLRVQLDEAIARHLPRWKSRHYDLLRDDPRFSRWIGRQRGVAGKKRLDRYILDMRERQPIRLARSVAKDTTERGANSARWDAERSPSVQVEVAGAGIGDSRIRVGEEGLYRRKHDLERALEALINEFGEMKDANAYARLNQQYLGVLAAIERRDERRFAVLNSDQFRDGLIECLFAHIPPPSRDDAKAAAKAYLYSYECTLRGSVE